jgi:acyl dehydratase
MHDDALLGDKLCHEDLELGHVYAFGHTLVTQAEIVGFARLYDPQSDPQYGHQNDPRNDPRAAQGAAHASNPSLVSCVCASPIHVCAIMMRMVCDGFLNRVASLGSPGVDEVRWLMPVRPGDAVSVRYTPLEKRVLQSRPDVGMSKILVELCNERGEPMATWRTNQLTRLRHAGPAARPQARRPRPGVVSLWDSSVLPQAPAASGCFFEDRQIGETTDLGSHTFGKDEMIAFARQFDPQPFHLDEQAAKASLFGNLSASGWQTAAIFNRQQVLAHRKIVEKAHTAGVRMAAYGPSPGIADLAWPKPVFVGDTVQYRTRVTGKESLASRPDRGLLVGEAQGRKQNGDIVFALSTQILVERRRANGG